jgi:hypothetical protein
MRLSRAGFETFGEADGLVLGGSGDEIMKSPAGTICVAALLFPKHTIGCLSGSRFRNIAPALPQEVLRTRAYSDHFAMIDHQGFWWISTALDVFRFRNDMAPNRLTSAMDSCLLPGRDVHRLYEDSLAVCRGGRRGLLPVASRPAG